MRLIKLSAIGSTNDYLKELLQNPGTENFTVVTAENQTAGRGQMGAKWNAESGKNLTFSIYSKNPVAETAQLFDLNVAVAVAILNALTNYNLAELSVKWPNDILSGKKKIGGVLIENSVRSSGSIDSVIGIGLNVNQTDFHGLPNASSIAIESGTEIDKWELLQKVAVNVESNISNLDQNADVFWQTYHDNLFKKDIPMPFENDSGHRFMGIIRAVSRDGKLRVQLEDDRIMSFGLREIKMLY